VQLEVRGATVAFGDRQVLRNLDLNVDAPKMVALMGPSGSGKSTLLAVIAGVSRLDSGIVKRTNDGRPPGRLEWIVQSSPLLARRTALANVALGPLSTGASVATARDIAHDWMQRLSIDQLEQQRVFRLSGGERQRVAVARAICTRAELILADEPTASLDAQARANVCDALEQASDAGALVLVATHDQYVADRCAVAYQLVDGRLVEK
jgi:ABC-type lipoprotein export system ATPase subunit